MQIRTLLAYFFFFSQLVTLLRGLRHRRLYIWFICPRWINSETVSEIQRRTEVWRCRGGCRGGGGHGLDEDCNDYGTLLIHDVSHILLTGREFQQQQPSLRRRRRRRIRLTAQKKKKLSKRSESDLTNWQKKKKKNWNLPPKSSRFIAAHTHAHTHGVRNEPIPQRSLLQSWETHIRLSEIKEK